MSKRMQADLARCLKAIHEWEAQGNVSRLDFHTQRAEQRMLELCLNFVVKHHKAIQARAALSKALGE